MFLLLLTSLLFTAPLIDIDHAVVEPIRDANIGEFSVRGIRIAVPEQGADTYSIVVDTCYIKQAIVRDSQTGGTYQIATQHPIVALDDGTYAVRLKVAGGKFPLRMGQLSTEFELAIVAHAVSSEGTASPTAIRSRWFRISREEFLPKP